MTGCRSGPGMFPSEVWWPWCSRPLAGPCPRGKVAAQVLLADQACSPPHGAPWSHSGLPSLLLRPGPSLPSTPPGSSTGSKKCPPPARPPPQSLNRKVAGQTPLTERYKARRRTDWPSGGRRGWAGNVRPGLGWGRGGGAAVRFTAVPWECQPEALSLRAPLCGCWPPFPPACGLGNLQRDLPPASSVGPDQATSPLDTHSTSIYGLTGHWFQHTVNEHLLHTAAPAAGNRLVVTAERPALPPSLLQVKIACHTSGEVHSSGCAPGVPRPLGFRLPRAEHCGPSGYRLCLPNWQLSEQGPTQDRAPRSCQVFGETRAVASGRERAFPQGSWPFATGLAAPNSSLAH